MKVMRSVIIEASIDKVWRIVREFDAVVDWNPAVTAARMENGTPTSVGAIRHLDIIDNTVFRETLLGHSDQEYFYSYDIVEGPLNCQNYTAIHRFIPITHGNQTLGIWSGEFECDPRDETSLETIVGDQIYRDGMLGLNNYMKGQNDD